MGTFFSSKTLSRLRAYPHHRITNFLAAHAARQILREILDQRQNFCAMTGNRNFIRLPKPLELQEEFLKSLCAVLPDVQERFAIDLEHPDIELYVHAYNDGTHFDAHSDAYGGGNWRRRLSCVYYLHCVPRRFEGGDLVIYDGYGRPNAVEPEHNSAVFFPSNLIHEVLPVVCHSKAFEDSRFAINVWVM